MQQSNEIKQINITEIKPNRFQPRIKFDEKALQELANSIKKYGIIEPLILRKIPNGYEAQIRPRSGLALKHGVTVLNSPGTIDAK